MIEPAATAQRDNWDEHWADYAESVQANPAQAMRRRLIMGTLQLSDTDRLIDIGCGQGDLLSDLARELPEAQLHGLDVTETGITMARAKVPTARFLRHDLFGDDPLPADYSATMSHGICSEVLEHLDEPALFLRRASALIRPGGAITITVPGGPRSAFDVHIGHRRHFTAKALRAVIVEAGLEPVRVRRLGFPFFNVYKLVTVLRGKKLIEDIRKDGDRPHSGLAGLVMKVFDVALRVPTVDTPFGWQLVAVARTPASS